MEEDLSEQTYHKQIVINEKLVNVELRRVQTANGPEYSFELVDDDYSRPRGEIQLKFNFKITNILTKRALDEEIFKVSRCKQFIN